MGRVHPRVGSRNEFDVHAVTCPYTVSGEKSLQISLLYSSLINVTIMSQFLYSRTHPDSPLY